MSPMQIRIAFAAETILYAPVHMAIEAVNQGDSGFEFVADVSPHGDADAYKRLQSNAAFCVCDPIVVYKDMEERGRNLGKGAKKRRSSEGVVVGSVVAKSGLWVVATQDHDAATRELSTLQTLLEDPTRPALGRGKTLTYDHGSTGGQTLQYIIAKSIEKPTKAHPVRELGRELEYLLIKEEYDKRQAKGECVSSIITCNLLELLACEYELVPTLQEGWRPWRLLDLQAEAPFSRQLFTALIARRAFLQDERGRNACLALLQALQAELDLLHDTSRTNWDRIDAWARQTAAFRVEKPPYLLKDGPVRLLCRVAFQELTAKQILPRSVAVTRDAWSAGLEVWKLDWKRRSLWNWLFDADRFRKCVDTSLVASLAPKAQRRRRWRRWVGNGIAALFALLVVLFTFMHYSYYTKVAEEWVKGQVSESYHPWVRPALIFLSAVAAIAAKLKSRRRD